MIHLYEYIPMIYVILYLPYILNNSILQKSWIFLLKCKTSQEFWSPIRYANRILPVHSPPLPSNSAGLQTLYCWSMVFNKLSHWIIRCWDIKSIQNIFNLLEGKRYELNGLCFVDLSSWPEIISGQDLLLPCAPLGWWNKYPNMLPWKKQSLV